MAGSTQYSSIQQLVNENPIEEFIQAADVLQKFAGNILKSPNEAKFRKIRLGNPVVESKLLPVSGALECLFEMGFEEDGEYLTLPVTAPIRTIRSMHDQLLKEKEVAQKNCASSSSQAQPKPRDPTPSQPKPNETRPSGPAQRPPQALQSAMSGVPDAQILQSEAKFYMKLQNSMSHVSIYEDASLQQAARAAIPISQLEGEAKSRWETVEQEAETANTRPLDVRDFLLIALLNWFKTSFFKWVDAPDCESCGGRTSLQGMVAPTPIEEGWGGNRVENYQCNDCQKLTRFPRYNHPLKLLETRRGRCGEWANCFTLCCRAMNYEARYVLDWTDHVWTEVYSVSQQRWLHSDPCENTCDKPLLYEVGWGKKLTYVIAFGKDDIQDVSWRYSADHKALLQRRTDCREKWLVYIICQEQDKFWQGSTEERKKVLMERAVLELVDFLTEQKADKDNLSGRTTGSMEWRTSRGEMGQGASQAHVPYVFKLSEEERQSRKLHVFYSCAGNEYVRESDGGTSTAGYQTLTHSVENIFRKEELDWKMVYLARTEGTDKADIAWKFDFSDSGLKIDKIEICVDSATYESGKIHWMICGQETCAMLTGGPSLQTVTDLEGETGMTLTASLRGGNGSVAWQHTQLFRQANNDTNARPLEIIVYLK